MTDESSESQLKSTAAEHTLVGVQNCSITEFSTSASMHDDSVNDPHLGAAENPLGHTTNSVATRRCSTTSHRQNPLAFQAKQHSNSMTASPKTKAPAPAEQPTPIAAQPTAAPQPLKRLQVVAQAGSLAYTTGEHLYKRLKAVTPPFVAPGLERVEGVAGQVLPTVSQTAEQLLRAADARVDSLLDGLDAKAGGKPLESLLSALSAAGDYAVIVAKEGSASVAAGVQSARDSLQAAVDKAREATDPDVGVAMAWDAWAKFSSYPPVKAFLERAEPATNLALQTFLSIHNNLVTSYVYKTAVNTTASTLNYASTTTPYKLGAQYLYPFVQPVADPAITKVAQSKVIGQVIDYWKPQAAPAPVNAH